MRKIRNVGLVMAIEEAELAALPQAEVEMVPETQAEVEVASTEVSEQVAEVDDLTTAVEEAEADAETLGDIQEVMAETVESGEGMDPAAAEITEIAVESICARLGIKSKQSMIPAMESFGSKSSRLAATKVAIESFTETIKKIWNAIWSALKMVWEKVKSFFVGLLKNRNILVKHLESLQKKVADISNDATQAEKELKIGAAKAFSIDGKASFATATTILDNSSKLTKAIGIGSAHASNIASRLLNTSTAAEVLENSAIDLLNNVRGAVEPLGKVTSHVKEVDGVTMAHYGNLAFGKSVGLTLESKGKGKAKPAAIITLEDNSDKMAESIEALTKAQMSDLLKNAIAVTKELQTFDKVEKDLAKIAKACDDVTQAVLKGAANNEVKGADDEEGKKKAESINAGAANVRALNSMVAKFGSSLPSVVFQAAKASGDYVSASVSNFKAKKEEAPAKAA